MAVIAAAAIGAVGAIGSSLAGGGSGNASKLQKRAINGSQPQQTTLNIPGLGTSSVSGGKGPIEILTEGGQFQDLSTLLGGLATSQATEGPLFNLDDTGFTAGNVGLQGLFAKDAFSKLQSSVQGLQSFNQDEFAAKQFDRLQALASRGDEIAANRVGNSLFARGRLGGDDTASGAAFEGLARAQEDARTQRALQSFGLADQAFQQQQGIVESNFNTFQGALQQQQVGVQGFTGLQGLLQGARQQNIQNTLGLAQGAGSVLDPVFLGVQTALQARLGDQSNRVSAATGAATSAAPIIAQSNAARADAIGNVFGGIASSVADSNINIFGGKKP